MALSEIELDQLIASHLSKDLDANIEVPDIEDQWQKIKGQILKDNPVIKRTSPNIKRVAVAAAILISIGSLNFLYPNNANAVGGKIAEFFNYIVGKTTQNKAETYKSVKDSGVPTIQDVGDIFEKEVTLAEAQTSIPFKLATPSYLPHGANITRVVLTSLGADVYQISIEYNFNERAIVFSQQVSSNGISRGTLYDTDDTVIKELFVNGSPAILFMRKNRINTLNWETRGLLLQIKGEITEDEIIKMAQSVK
ncbi:DUF4367 domain-containing protein [Desulfosporosinus fructosivorans]|uniref:DUF4367 domain-containing protein n=1 Tax=Desulfosporosinus fructosivorans TaxID=2018669 RepID=A0A4Z0RB01_9FIRM|nr:DUF4367 domain-containing protein [Desulfosporosinus fructosivorans]TGE39459.1 DUF4367 domain-containing protein [Desulfosporosinus fructosivorans]